MKCIAIISPEYLPFMNKGGIATFAFYLAKILSMQKYAIHVITYDGDAGCEKTITSDGITIHTIKYRTDNKLFNFLYYKFPLGLFRMVCITLGHSMLVEMIDWEVFSLFAFMRLHKRYTFDVVHSASFGYPTLVAFFFHHSIPCILHIQSTQDELNRYEKNDFDHRLKAQIEAWDIQHLSTRIICCTRREQATLVKKYPQIQKKISFMHNTINTKEYKHATPADIHNLVFMGRLDYRKGADLLLDVFVKLAQIYFDLHIWFIGENTESFPVSGGYTDFYTVFRSKNLPPSILTRIHLLPRIDDRKRLIEMLQAIKGIGIFPSRYESFGYVVIEAMALGYIVVASENGGGPEIIHHSVDGFLIKPTVVSLYAQVKTILEMSTVERKRISEQAIQNVRKNFDHTVAVEQMKNVYASLFPR